MVAFWAVHDLSQGHLARVASRSIRMADDDVGKHCLGRGDIITDGGSEEGIHASIWVVLNNNGVLTSVWVVSSPDVVAALGGWGQWQQFQKGVLEVNTNLTDNVVTGDVQSPLWAQETIASQLYKRKKIDD